MKQIILSGILALAASTAAHGQNQILQQINDIKAQSDTYYWSQYAHVNADSARYNATKWILMDINDGRNEDKLVTLDEIIKHVKHIKMQRGSVTRDFAYIRKSDVPGSGAKQPDGNMSEPPKPKLQQEPQPFVPDMFTQRIMQQKTFKAVYNFLRSQKAEGKIAMFGPLKEVDDFSSLQLIVFDLSSQEVITVLSPVTQGDTRINLTTGGDDALGNYPEDMVAVIYFIK